MGIEIRLPNITATNTAGQVAQLQSYMIQQLNWALNTIDSTKSIDDAKEIVNKSRESISPEKAQDTFNSIKSLIIKSADIIEAYEETIKTNFDGKYVAESDFGTYKEQTNDNNLKTTNAYIKRGLLYYNDDGKAVYGVEVGNTTDDGTFNKYARFISDRLSFYDTSGNEVAYISNQRLYITDAIFLGILQIGKYKVDTFDGLAFTWIGG